MADIFGRTATPDKVFKSTAESVSIKLAGQANLDPFMCQNVQFNYAQRVTRLWDLADPQKVAYIAARPEGVLRFAHIVMKMAAVQEFYAQLGNPCTEHNSANNTLSLSLPDGENCVELSHGGFTFHNCLLTNVGMSVSVQDYVVNDSVEIMFTHVDSGVTASN